MSQAFHSCLVHATCVPGVVSFLSYEQHAPGPFQVIALMTLKRNAMTSFFQVYCFGRELGFVSKEIVA